MSTERKLIVGLADEAVGRQVANVVANVTAGVNTLGFFGAAATQQQGVTLSNVTSVAQALINLGLAVQNT
jgi:hypothetical protein